MGSRPKIEDINNPPAGVDCSNMDEVAKIDNVNHPPHYKNHPSGVECIDVTEHMNFNRGNAVKYVWRAGEKIEPGKTRQEKEIEDLEKAVWYLNREIERMKKCNTDQNPIPSRGSNLDLKV